MTRLLIEGATTNLLLRSEEADNASWTKTRTVAVANQITAPDGQLTADLVREDTSAGLTHLFQQAVSGVNGTLYTASALIKSSGRPLGMISLQGTPFTSARRAFFNLTTGEITGLTSNTVAWALSVGNGWWLCHVQAAANATGSGLMLVCPSPSPAATAYDGDGVSGICVWGMGVKAEPVGSSYVASGALNGTREADHARCALSAIGQASEGSLLIRAGVNRLPPSGVELGLFTMDDGTDANRLYARIDSAGLVKVGATVASVAQSDATIGTIAPGAMFNLAVSSGASGSLASLNGALAIAGAARPSGLTTLRLGHGKSDLSMPLFGEVEAALARRDQLASAPLSAWALAA